MRQSGWSFEWRQSDQKWLFSTSCLFTEDPDENIRTHNMIDHLLVALQMTRTRRNSTEPLASCTLPPKKGGAPGNYWKSLALTSRGVIPSRRLWLTIDIDEPKIVKKNLSKSSPKLLSIFQSAIIPRVLDRKVDILGLEFWNFIYNHGFQCGFLVMTHWWAFSRIQFFSVMLLENSF